MLIVEDKFGSDLVRELENKRNESYIFRRHYSYGYFLRPNLFRAESLRKISKEHPAVIKKLIFNYVDYI